MSWVALLPAIGGGAGLIKGLRDENRAKDQYKEQAIVARYSPWTGMAVRPVEKPDVLGSIMQGAASGLSMGQGMDQTEALQNMQSSYNDAAIRKMEAEADLMEQRLEEKPATPVTTPTTKAPSGKKVSSTWEAMLARSYA